MRYLKVNLCNEMIRIFTSIALYIGVVAIVISLFVSCSTEIGTGRPGHDVLYYHWVAHWQGFELLTLIAASLGAVSYCIDSKTKYDRYIILRSTRKSYAASKVIACQLTAVIVTGLGELLFVLLLLTFLPLHNPASPTFESRASIFPYGVFLQTGHYILYLTAIIIMRIGRSCIFSILSLVIAIQTRSVFVTIAVPVTLYYLIVGMLNQPWLPAWLNLYAILEGTALTQPIESLIYSILACLIINLIFMVVSYYLIEKRMLNE